MNVFLSAFKLMGTHTHTLDCIFEDLLRLQPVMATFLGYNEYDDQYIGSHTLHYRKLYKEFVLKYIDKVDNEPVIRYILESGREELKRFQGYLCPVSHKQNPFTTLLYTVEFQRTTDVEKFKTRVHAFLETIPELRTNILEGVKQGIVENRKSIGILIDDLRGIHRDVVRSSLVLPSRSQQSYLEFMNTVFIRAAKDFANFLEKTYLPYCKKSLGLYEFPEGWYAFALKMKVNMDIHPDKVFELGVSSVRRITSDIKQFKEANEQTGKNRKLRRIKFRSRNNMVDMFKHKMEHVLDCSRKIMTVPKDYKLPIVDQIPETQEKTEAGAYIMTSDMHNKAPQVFRINTGPWKEGINSVMNLIQHEVVPGHSIQTFIANTAHIHKVYKLFSFTDTTEGWALYSESLLRENNSPEDEYERLSMLLFRAVRLVCDVGMHHKGWSYTKVFNYMKRHVSNTLSDRMIHSEIMRYSSMPGQACAYFLGMTKIQEMRAKNISTMSEKEFNDAFLKLSNYPLFHIEAVMGDC